MHITFSGDAARNTLVVLIFLARLGDIGSTYLATPNLKLESNPIAKLGGWRFAILTVLACLIPFVSPPVGMTVLVLSLMVTGSNLSRGWIMRALGEDEYQAVLASAASRSSLPVALAFVMGSAASIGFAGLILLYLSGGPETWIYWASYGVALYALAMAVYGGIGQVRLFRSVRAVEEAQ